MYPENYTFKSIQSSETDLRDDLGKGVASWHSEVSLIVPSKRKVFELISSGMWEKALLASRTNFVFMIDL